MKKLLTALVFIAAAISAKADPCSTTQLLNCYGFCGDAGDATCTTETHQYCIDIGNNTIQCGHYRKITICACVVDVSPPTVKPKLGDAGGLGNTTYEIEAGTNLHNYNCPDGIGFDEETGSAYCL